MTILDYIQEANDSVIGIKRLEYANVSEANAFIDSFKTYTDFPLNLLTPFEKTDTLKPAHNNKTTLLLVGWVLTKLDNPTIDYSTSGVETTHIKPMKDLAREFIKNLVNSDLIDSEQDDIKVTYSPEYNIFDSGLFGVAYKIDLPVDESVC